MIHDSRNNQIVQLHSYLTDLLVEHLHLIVEVAFLPGHQPKHSAELHHIYVCPI
jgi:hypothetical protein